MKKLILSAFADEIDESLDKQMEVLGQHGIRFIEMRGVDGKVIVKYTEAEAEVFRRRLDANGFAVSAIGSPIGKVGMADDFSEHFDLFKHTVRLAEIMNTRYIRIFSFFMPKGGDPADWRGDVMERMKRFAGYAGEHGVMLLHENEKGIYGDIPERCLDILREVNSPNLRATFDPANFIQSGASPYPEAYGLLKGHIEYMHIKDALFSDHSVVPAGQGDGRVRDVLKSLIDDGFSGFLSIEPHLGNFKGFADLEPDSPGFGLEEGGPRKFAVALQALKKILVDLGADYE